jgi:hypothetical protein
VSYDEETTMDDVQMSFDVLGVLCVEGSPTGDGRMIDTNSLRWSLPLPLRRVREDFGAHNGAVVVGAIEKIVRTDGGELAYSGRLFNTPDGIACRDEMLTRYRSSGLKYGISVDLDDVVVEDDADVMVVKEGRLRGATLCDVPAYSEAWTMLVSDVRPSGIVASWDTFWNVESALSRLIAEGAEPGACAGIALTASNGMGSLSLTLSALIVANGSSRDAVTETMFDATRASENETWPVNGRTPHASPTKSEKLSGSTGDNTIETVAALPKSATSSKSGTVLGDETCSWNNSGTCSNDSSTCARCVDRELSSIVAKAQRGTRTSITATKPGSSAGTSAPHATEGSALSEIALTSSAEPPSTWKSARTESSYRSLPNVNPALAVNPPSKWFENPNLDGPTAITVLDDGRVFGHIALHGSCHLGFADRCVTPPVSRTDYAYFHTGALRTEEGSEISVGHLTMSTGHADSHYGPRPAAEHYDNTGVVAADVRAGSDRFGIWVAGAARPTLSDIQLREFRSAPMSGDWRTVKGNLELVGILAVNLPGFPVPRTRALVAGGAVQSLVASAVFDSEDVVEEPSTEMPPADVAAALEPEVEAEESKVEAEMGDDAEEKVEDQPDAEDAEEESEEDIEDGEMDMAATMGEMRDMMRAMAEEIRMMKESMAMPAIAGDEPALADAPAEDAEPVEPIPAIESAVTAEEMLKMLDAMVNGPKDMTKLLAELDAKVG